MSALLVEAVTQLGLQPGQTYRTRVNGHEIEVRVLEVAPKREAVEPRSPAEPAEEERSQFEDSVMLLPWFDIPDSPRAGVVKARFAPLPLPDPPIMPEDFGEDE